MGPNLQLVQNSGSFGSVSSKLADFFDLPGDYQAFVTDVSRGVQGIYSLLVSFDGKPGVRGGGLEGAPEQVVEAIFVQTSLVMRAILKAHSEFVFIARQSLVVALVGPPFEFKLPFRIYNFIAQRQGTDPRADRILEMMTQAGGGGYAVLETVSDQTYLALPRAQAKNAQLSGLGSAPAAIAPGTVILVVSILVAAVVVGYFISSTLKAETKAISDYAKTIDEMRACVTAGHCSQKQLDDIIARAPRQTDWKGIITIGVIGLGIFMGGIMLLSFRSEIKDTAALIIPRRAAPAAAVAGLSGLRRKKKRKSR